MGEREDKQDIAEVVQDWALWRDTGDWVKLRRAFHRDGVMTATWFTGTADEFVERCKASWERGSRGGHFMAGSSVRLNDDKALAVSKLILHSRGIIDDVEVDVTCYGRFVDRFVRAEGRWTILRRNAVYEKDRMDPLDKARGSLLLDQAILLRFPEGYRHLAYMQTKAGLPVNPELPTSRSAALERLMCEVDEWLAK
ncbi:MAG TPA: nuclear transport factor 2 family protein [Chloroflexota bacterium]